MHGVEDGHGRISISVALIQILQSSRSSSTPQQYLLNQHLERICFPKQHMTFLYSVKELILFATNIEPRGEVAMAWRS